MKIIILFDFDFDFLVPAVEVFQCDTRLHTFPDKKKVK